MQDPFESKLSVQSEAGLSSGHEVGELDPDRQPSSMCLGAASEALEERSCQPIFPFGGMSLGNLVPPFQSRPHQSLLRLSQKIASSHSVSTASHSFFGEFLELLKSKTLRMSRRSERLRLRYQALGDGGNSSSSRSSSSSGGNSQVAEQHTNRREGPLR